MNLFQELRQRRVFRITSGYVVGGWGLLQFIAFLESRMTVSPHLLNLIGFALLLLLPSVITMAWVHGRPGKDSWGRAPKIVLPANLVAASIVLVIMFSGRDLGAVTQTIAVEDENGSVTERVVPKNEYRRRILMFYPEFNGAEEDAWVSETFSYLLSIDLSQDGFVDPVLPVAMPNSFRAAGSTDGHGLVRPQQRKVARDAHIGHFLTSTMARMDGTWQLTTELHDSESGKILAKRTDEAATLYSLADHVSLQLREDLGIPAAHLNENPDLPIADLTSSDIQAVASHMKAVLAVTHDNDWEGGLPHSVDATERDPQFALGQFLLYAIRQTLSDGEGASTAIAASMENLYRVPERLGFMIKAQYYYNEKQDADKALAVIRMWTQIYPDDVNAYENAATFYFIRQDLPNAITAYEKILEIDPSRVNYLEDLADLHTQLGNLEEAEKCLKRYVDTFPSRADGYEDLSDFYSLTGRLDEAREALAQAQILDPENRDLALSLIDLDIKSGKYEESKQALSDLLKASKTGRERLRVHGRLLNIVNLQGRTEDIIALSDTFHAVLLETQNPMQANLVYCMMLPSVSEAGRPDEALKRLAAVKPLILDPYCDLAGVGEAWAYSDQGLVSEARAVLGPAIVVVESFKFETFRSTIALVEGGIDVAAGDLDAAIVHYRDAYEKAVRMEPILRYKMAAALRLAGEENEAMEVINEGIKSDPLHPQYHLELAQIQYLKGDHDKAREHLAISLNAWAGASAVFPPAQEARKLDGLLNTPR